MGARLVAHGSGRVALLNAAIRVVARNGLRNLTLRATAAEAGVTHGLVAHHFGNRAALVEEALQHSLQATVDGSRLLSPQAGFDGLAQALASLVEGDPDMQAFQYELLLEARRRPELQPLTDRLYEGYRTAVREQLNRNGIEAPAVVTLVLGALDGLVLQQLVGEHDRAATIAAVQALVDLIDRDLASPLEALLPPL